MGGAPSSVYNVALRVGEVVPRAEKDRLMLQWLLGSLKVVTFAPSDACERTPAP